MNTNSGAWLHLVGESQVIGGENTLVGSHGS